MRRRRFQEESQGRGANPEQVSDTTVSETKAVRTLVKSPPEIWAACSDAESLARHLDGFGEIRITRLEPETTVAWEGERASGTVTIEPTGWGTKVTLTATAPDAVEDQPVADAKPAPEPVEPPRRRGFFARMLHRDRPRQPIVEPEPEPVIVEEPGVAPGPEAALGAALDSLGQAHHRPFSQF